MLEVIPKLHWCLSAAREFPGVRRVIRELVEEDRLSADAWQAQNLRRLRNVLGFAGDHVPYYRGVFAQLGFEPRQADLLANLDGIPMLTKELVAANLGELLAENTDPSQLHKNATGGSTGIPLRFYQDRRYQAVAAGIDAFVRRWWGVTPYDRAALVWGADREFADLSVKERFYQWRHRIRSLNAFRMSERELIAFCRMLLRWRPPYLMGYAGALEALARCARDEGIDNLRFRAIRSAAEMLWPHQRRLIEETFRSPVFDFYGSREINNLAAECPEQHSLHLISTWRYVEIVDEQGHPVPHGTVGQIVVTDLSNYGMPFVRYQNGDMGALAVKRCLCGRPSPVLERLLGRSSDMIRTPRGEIVHGEFFTHLFYGTDCVRQFQLHQTALDHAVLRYVPAGPGHEAFIRNAVGKIRERLGSELVVDVELCDRIPVPPSGKYRFTISDVDLRAGAA